MRTLTQSDPTKWHKPLPRTGRGKAKEPYYFEVHGDGFFPTDMLRHDRAWAVTGMDSPPATPDGLWPAQKHRTVIVASWRHELTDDRWASFGWVVVERLKQRPSFLPPFQS